jgi:fructose-bisphosphate aldolase class II
VLPIAAAAASVADSAGVPIGLHLDHVDDEDLLHRAADAGFSSAMYDAGALPYAENVARTRAAAEWAHAAGLWLEAELGYVGGKPGAPESAHAAGVRTDPDEAAAFVAATGVDALAVAVGSSHAMTSRTATLDTALVSTLAARVPVPLVLHGSSGVSEDQLRAAVRAGIVKVNVGTALNAALTGTVRSVVAHDPALVDPRKYLGPGRSAMTEVVADLLRALGDTVPGCRA